MSTLRENFEVITLRRFDIKDMPSFIDDIYSCDTYPISHLRAKNQYLMSVPKEIIFVLVKNNNVNEREAGSGDFRGVQCEHVIRVKNEIRERFNPAPHNHVIHGTDYESQTEHILKVLGLPGVEYFSRKPYHLPIVNRDMRYVDLDSLRANILGAGLVAIEDTPHYAYLKGDKGTYETYFFKYMGRGLNEDHFPEAFDKLIEQGEYEPIIVCGTRILDGVHRAAILKFRGEKKIEAWI